MRGGERSLNCPLPHPVQGGREGGREGVNLTIHGTDSQALGVMTYS